MESLYSGIASFNHAHPVCFPIDVKKFLRSLSQKISWRPSTLPKWEHSLKKHMVRKLCYNFQYLKNMLKIRSHGVECTQYCNLIKFGEQIANSFSKIANGRVF